ncbi:LysR family transcriptional regulator [Williamsia maris]|uniref:DNA-binding transcriptional regulator, LysR family n=1 Tax=Williamsia maris TaxID=72806 RepID=A0ABT1H9P2_9NOCA|nr:LysR family transcriptional regulator [Williamsia maris]MCP2174934.1 DNA-binding transcriptional regulator, LysR family [Williamsia maris]
MDVELALLRLLVEIDRTGSMTGAARSLQYTPSAVSQQVRRLESAVGTTLFERHARGVRLTDAGRIVLARASAIETNLRALSSELDDLAGARSGQLTLGVFPTFAASFLPRVIETFRSDHPGVELHIRSSRLRRLRQMLHARDVDLALAWDYPEAALVEDGLEFAELGRDPTVVLAPAGRFGDAQVDLADLADESWIVRADGHPITEVFRSACRTAGFDPQVLIEANDYMESQAMVAAGLGLSVAPVMTTWFLRDDVDAIDTNGQLPDRRVLLGAVAGRVSPAGEAMRATLQTLPWSNRRDL